MRPKAVGVPVESVWLEAFEGVLECKASGDVYIDGSARGLFWRAMRGGWSVVALDEWGQHSWTKRGVLGGLNISSHRAELRALLEALRCAAPTIHVDNQSVVDGVAEGRQWCTSAGSSDADLWRVVWEELEEARSRGEVGVAWVKAHTRWDGALSRLIWPRHQYGNWLADAAAKSSARYLRLNPPLQALGRRSRKP